MASVHRNVFYILISAVVSGYFVETEDEIYLILSLNIHNHLQLITLNSLYNKLRVKLATLLRCGSQRTYAKQGL